MKRLKNILVLSAICGTIMGLYAFAGARHHSRKLAGINISFTDYSDPLVSEKNVNKLLIVKEDTLANPFAENLDLNKSEMRLDAHPMIRNAEVSVDLNGNLNALVEQRMPIARILGSTDTYLDMDNEMMPLSSEHAVQVPIVSGFKAAYQEDLYNFLMYVRKDELLNIAVTQVSFDSAGEAMLWLRAHRVKVMVGKLDGIEWKMPNFKAMIAKLEKDKTIDTIDKIDLRFNHQVIIVKKD